MEYAPGDLEYIRANYLTLEQLCSGRGEVPREIRASIGAGRLPQPSYVLDDGTAIFPADYFRFVDEAGGPDSLREQFAERLTAAGGGAELETQWQTYLDGRYGVCLWDVTRKGSRARPRSCLRSANC